MYYIQTKDVSSNDIFSLPERRETVISKEKKYFWPMYSEGMLFSMICSGWRSEKWWDALTVLIQSFPQYGHSPLYQIGTPSTLWSHVPLHFWWTAQLEFRGRKIYCHEKDSKPGAPLERCVLSHGIVVVPPLLIITHFTDPLNLNFKILFRLNGHIFRFNLPLIKTFWPDLSTDACSRRQHLSNGTKALPRSLFNLH